MSGSNTRSQTVISESCRDLSSPDVGDEQLRAVLPEWAEAGIGSSAAAADLCARGVPVPCALPADLHSVYHRYHWAN